MGCAIHGCQQRSCSCTTGGHSYSSRSSYNANANRNFCPVRQRCVSVKVVSVDWIVCAVCKLVQCKQCRFRTQIRNIICIDKPANRRIIVPTLQIIEPRLLVVHIATIPQRIQLRKGTGRCQDLAPGIVAIARHGGAVAGFNAYYIALQVGDVIIDLPPRSADLSNRQNPNIRTLPLVQCCRFTLLTSIFIPL